jgi:hypothetical protein
MSFPKLENGMVTGRLTQAERTRIAAVLDERGAPQDCECCGKRQWSLGGHIVTTQGLARHPTHFTHAPADPLYPSVLLMCDNCGNTKLLNLAILGLGDDLFPKAPDQ